MANKTAPELWQDYRFLTQEMIKFLAKPDMDLFYELMNQRERLQTMIEQTGDGNFRNSIEGQRLLTEIQHNNQQMSQDLQLQLNRVKRLHQVSEVYSEMNSEPVSQLTWKR